jgi:hypothetical protein
MKTILTLLLFADFKLYAAVVAAVAQYNIENDIIIFMNIGIY